MKKENKVDQFIKNPKKALLTLAYPTLIAMIVQIMYNIVDTAFVGRLGAEAIAALTFSFPIFFILIALNQGIAIGMASRISRFLGGKKKESAENTAMHGLFISLGLAIVIFFAGILTLKPLFSVFGATASVIELSMQYMSVILIGIFFMFPAFVLGSMFTAQGDTKTPMKVQVIALLLNIILDPIFIYVLGYGVKGAAIATSITFFVALFLFIHYIKRKSYLQIRLRSFKYSFPICKEICKVGAPATLIMLLMSVYIIFINRFMAHFGTNYVASFGIASRLESVAVMPILAISTSVMTLVGMFFGAKRYDLLKNIIRYAVIVGSVFTSVMGFFFYLFPSFFLRIFTPDITLLNLASAYLRVAVFTFPIMAIGLIIGRAMQGMGFGLPALVITCVRILIVAVPLAYVFVFVLGYSYLSIAVAMIVGGVVSDIIASIWLRSEIKNLNSN